MPRPSVLCVTEDGMTTPTGGGPLVESKSRTPFPLGSVVFLVIIFFLNFTSRVVLSPLLPILEPELGMGHGKAGSLFLLIQTGYCVGLLVSGFISWRLNHRRTILLSSLSLGIVLLGTARSTSLSALRVGLVLIGTTAGLYLPSGIATITREVRQEHWGKALALHELAPNLGYIAAPLLAEALLRVLPWHGVLGVMGALSVAVGMCYMAMGRGGRHHPEPPRVRWMALLLGDPALWVTAMLFAVSIGAGLGFYTMMPLFLVEEVGLEREAANLIAGLCRVPGVAVVFLAGVVTDRIGHRRALTLFLAATGTFTILLGLLHGRLVTPLLIFAQAAAAVCFFPVGFSMIALIFPAGLRGLAVSLVTVIGSLLGAGAIPAGIGYLAELASFSAALCLLGLLMLSMLPLLRFGRAGRF